MKRIEKELTGAPIQVGATTLRPVAHLHARLGAPRRASYGLVWGVTRLEPVALMVDGPDGAVRRIAVANSDDRAARRLLWAGLLVAVLSATAIVARRLAR
jgi:hypothetical protein